MTDISNYWRNILYNVSVGGVNATAPTDVYLALFTAASDDENGTEVADANYVRQIVDFSSPTNGVGANDVIVEYPAAATGFTATHARLMDDVSGGNPLTKIVALDEPKVVGASAVLRFLVGDVDFEIL